MPQPLTDQPTFEIAHQRFPDPATKPFRQYVTERYLAVAGGHGDTHGFVLQERDVQVQPPVGEPGKNVFDGLVMGPVGNGSKVVAVVGHATDPDGALYDATNDAGVRRGCLAGV